MVRSTFPWVFGGTLVLLVLAIGVPALFHEPESREQQLPWQIEQVGETTKVFGLTLGQTTVLETAQRLGDPPVVTLFYKPDGELALEAFFQHMTMGGLNAKLVVTVDALSPETLQGMFDRGVGISTLGSGTRKVTLASSDVAQVMHAPIGSLTYLPAINIAPELLLQRFGEPAERIEERDERGGFVHWLYPERGLGVAVSERQNEVFVYVPPGRFEASVAAPLRATHTGDE